MSILKKLGLSSVIVSLLTIVLVAISINVVVNNYIVNDIKKEVTIQNQKLVEILKYRQLISKDSERVKYMNDMSKNISTKNILNGIIDKDNEVLTGVWMRKFADEDYDEIIGMIVSNPIESIKYVEFGEKHFYLYTNKVTLDIDGDMDEYTVFSIIYNEEIKELTQDLVFVIVGLLVFLSVVSLGISLLISKKITKPIKELVTYTKKIKTNMKTKPVNIKTGDEIEVLADSIMSMVLDLNQKEQVQREFFEHVSHDFKTPLTVISGYAEGLKNGIFEEDEPALDVIVKECRDLKKQIEDVIYLSRLEDLDKRIQEDSREDVNLTSVIGQVLSEYNYILTMNDIDVETKFDPVTYLNCNRENIKRLFSNVLSNCIKYTDNKVYVATKCVDSSVEIIVEDNGVGFSDEQLDNPFKGYYVGGKGGNGIGLLIIKKILDQHEGEIKLTNSSQGARYYIKLPIGR